MTDEELRNDAKYAHAVFDLCGIRSTTRGSQPASLRLRALMLAEEAGHQITLGLLDEYLERTGKSS
jgi:hypothetical protein